jgi:hypothetical protein
MSEAGFSSTSPDCQTNEAAAYTIEDRGSLLDEKQISGFISSMEAVDERSPCPRQVRFLGHSFALGLSGSNGLHP